MNGRQPNQQKFSYLTSLTDLQSVRLRSTNPTTNNSTTESQTELSIQTNENIALNDIPDYLPPPNPSDLEIFGEEGCKIIGQLEMILREFNDNGRVLSETVKLLPESLNNKWENALLSAVILPEQQEYVSGLIDDAIISSTIIFQASDPFPDITITMAQKEKFSLSFSEVITCFNVLHDSIVNPKENEEFKKRAVNCVLLTLNYEKIINCPLNVKEDMDKLIVAMQRVMRLQLYADRALEKLMSLLKHTIFHKENCQLIQSTVLILQDLRCRSDVIKQAVEEVKKTFDLVTHCQPRYKNNPEFTKNFISNLVEFIMESPIQFDKYNKNEQTFLDRILHKINCEYVNNEASMIYSCDLLYFDVISLLKNSESTRKADITNLTYALAVIHENLNLHSIVKLEQMKNAIRETVQNIEVSLYSFVFFGRRGSSRLVIELKDYIDNKMFNHTPYTHIRYQQYLELQKASLQGNTIFNVLPKEIVDHISKDIVIDNNLGVKL